MPFNTTPGSRRVVPDHPSDEQVKRIHDLLEQCDGWVPRHNWDAFLDEAMAPDAVLVPVAGLTRDQRVAAGAWVRQQQHHLHRVLHGERVAPADWLDGLPLYRALRD